MTRISLVRHGLVHNPGQIYYGRLPGFGLAEKGRQQAAAAGRSLVYESVVAVYHSPQLRAQQTADILRDHCATDAPLEECTLLNEIYSPYDGFPIEEMERREWNFYQGLNPPYEQPEDIVARIIYFFDQTRAKYPGQHVVGVSHADPIAFAILWATGLPLTADQRKRLTECGIADSYPAPASISTFTFSNETDGGFVGLRYHAPDLNL